MESGMQEATTRYTTRNDTRRQTTRDTHGCMASGTVVVDSMARSMEAESETQGDAKTLVHVPEEPAIPGDGTIDNRHVTEHD